MSTSIEPRASDVDPTGDSSAVARLQRVEQALQQSKEFTRRLTDVVPGILYIYDIVEQRNVWGNREMVALLGYSEADLASMKGELLQRLVHPDDLVRYRGHLERLMGLPDGVPADFEYRILRADGTWVWLHSRDQVFHRDDAGRPRRIVGAAFDITDRRRVEEQLRESERRLAAVLNNTLSSIFLMDDRQHCIYMNAAAEQLTGYTLAETTGRPLHDVVHHTHPDGRTYPLAECPIDQAFPTRNQMQGEETFVHRDGSFYPVAFTASPVRDESGRTIGTVIEVRDIRAEKEAAETLRRSEEALREADRRKDQFLAILSHELRNPLAPIRTAAQLLAKTNLDESQAAKARDIIQRQVRQMALLLDDLLDVARITQGKLQLKRKQVSLPSVVDAAVETARPLIEAKRHALRVDLPEIPPELYADPLRLGQVLSNLLTNAAKYTDPGGNIELSARVEGDHLELRVRDDGIGITPALRQRLFTMFAQGEGCGRHSEGGLGIGLALVKGLVELHAGSIEGESEGARKGSTFVVRLPLPPHERATPLDAGSLEEAQSGARRVLVVDDNCDAADSLGMLLHVSGHDVRVAHGGRVALSLAEEFRPEVVLLDIGMPDLDGYAVARQMRAQPWGADVCLVALTGWGQDEDRRRTRLAGFDHHLTKPIDPEKIAPLLGQC